MRALRQSFIWLAGLVTSAAVATAAYAQLQPPEPTETERIKNDYYANPEAKRVIDAIIEAHGGRERIEALDRMKVTMHLRMFDRETDITVYQTRSAIRRDTDSAATRRGCVHAIFASTPRPASKHILGNCVVFPDPVSPATITTG